MCYSYVHSSCPTHIVSFVLIVFALCFVYPSLDCPFLIAPSIFSKFINLFLIFSFTDVVRLQVTITITFSNMQCKHKANADINIAIFISKINMESCLLGMDMDVGVSVLKVLTFKSVRITW